MCYLSGAVRRRMLTNCATGLGPACNGVPAQTFFSEGFLLLILSERIHK